LEASKGEARVLRQKVIKHLQKFRTVASKDDMHAIEKQVQKTFEKSNESMEQAFKKKKTELGI
jgi:ribosome recycling factor